MKKSELIAANRERITDEAKEAYAHVIRCAGTIEVQIYIWSDGEIETHENVTGSNSYLVAKDCESRKLYHVMTVKQPGFCWENCVLDSLPDSPEDREAMKEEIEELVISEYDPADDIDRAIDNAEREE